MGSIKAFRLKFFQEVFNCNIFVETGTGMGESLKYAAGSRGFAKLLSCEIEAVLFERAKLLMDADRRIQIINKDSINFLAEIVPKLGAEDNCLFWLDAHFPGADFGLKTYDAEKDLSVRLPLKKEIEILKKERDLSRDVIIVDDLRMYERGPFAGGNLPEQYKPLVQDGTNIVDVENSLKDTHTVLRDYRDQGYLLLIPDKKIKGFITKHAAWLWRNKNSHA